MNQQSMTLNIPYDAPATIWAKIPAIYRQLPGWLEENLIGSGIPYWFGYNEDKKHVCASVEPGGLLFTALMEDDEWETWTANIKRIATAELGYQVGEIESGEVDE